MESLPRLSGGRALSPDMLCQDSEEPGCSGGVLPDASTELGPGTLARKLSRLQEAGKWALAQCRGTNYLGARKLSRYRNLIAGRCAL